jgi:hypothetical protein
MFFARILRHERRDEWPEIAVEAMLLVALRAEEVLTHVERRTSVVREEEALLEADAVAGVLLCVIEQASPHALGEADARVTRSGWRRRDDAALIDNSQKPFKCPEPRDLGDLCGRVLSACRPGCAVRREMHDVLGEVRSRHDW